MKTRALQLDLMNSNSYDDWKVLALAILSYEFSLVHSGENIDMVADLYTDAADYVDIALETIMMYFILLRSLWYPYMRLSMIQIWQERF